MADDLEKLSGNLDVTSKATTPTVDMKGRLKALNLMSNPATAEWIQSRRRNIRPWSTFLNTSRFSVPNNIGQCYLRIPKNLNHFQSNYIFVFLGLVAYCFVTSPLLLLTIAATCGACYIVRQKNVERKLRIFGHELTLVEQYAVVSICAVPFFLYAGAGSAVFWIIGASFVLIMIHATFFAVETLNIAGDEEEGFALQMETI